MVLLNAEISFHQHFCKASPVSVFITVRCSAVPTPGENYSGQG